MAAVRSFFGQEFKKTASLPPPQNTMINSPGNASAHNTPAWKKLGLKLKQSDASQSANGTPGVGQPDSTHEGPTGKRKFGAQSKGSDDWYNGNKKPRTSSSSHYHGRPEQASSSTPALKRKKSVTFGETPTKNEAVKTKTSVRALNNPKPATTLPPATPKKSKGPAKKVKPVPPTDTRRALEYLNLWKVSRDAWKFNKNHQSTLIKVVFEGDSIPAADVATFYDYIKDLKGLVRSRLRETAMEIRIKDRTEGSAMFPADTMDIDSKQATYETILSEWLQSQQLGQKRHFNETDFITTVQEDDLILKRAVKRARAEMIIDTLSDGNETDVSTTSVVSARATADRSAAAKDATKINGIPGKRRRKLRVSNLSDDSSSSESESDNDSDTSSASSSSDDSDSDDEEEEDEEDDDGDDSSSSSSSSSSGEDDDDDSDDEANDSSDDETAAA